MFILFLQFSPLAYLHTQLHTPNERAGGEGGGMNSSFEEQKKEKQRRNPQTCHKAKKCKDKKCSGDNHVHHLVRQKIASSHHC